MERLLACLAGVLLCGIPAATVAQSVPPQALPIESFSKSDEFHGAKISPDGETLAIMLVKNGNSEISIIDLNEGNKVYGTLGDDNFEFSKFEWVTNTRLIYMLSEHYGDVSVSSATRQIPSVILEVPSATTRTASLTREIPSTAREIFAIDRDMRKQAMIFGYRPGAMSTGSYFKGREASRSYPTFISRLRNDDKQILISEQEWHEGSFNYFYDPDSKPRLTLLNVYTGAKKNLGAVPLGGAEVLVDNDGQPRFATGLDKESKPAVAWKPTPKDDWQTFVLPGFREGSIDPKLLGDDNETVFVIATPDKQTYAGLYRVGLKSLAIEKVFAFPDADIGELALDFTGRKIVGVIGHTDKPVYHWLDEKDPAALLYQALQRAFPKQSVRVTDTNADGRKAIVLVSSDTNPGDYYLFDTQTMKAMYLNAVRPWINPKRMRPKQSFTIKARDGLQLQGYLTRPVGAGPFPLVVLPHGGPDRVRDSWDFNLEAQLLANRGYAVLQVNYRGSGGFGIDFEEAGHREWGARMQDDLTDATRWALEQKVTTADRICIHGAGYGGYAALMGAIREPGLYQCAIGYLGIYDLELMHAKGDTHRMRSGRDYLDTVLGTDKEQLRARSPVFSADKIEIPVLLIQGKEDWRMEFEHARRMKAALEENNKSFEWTSLEREGDSFYDEKSRRELYERLLAFLDKHLMKAAH